MLSRFSGLMMRIMLSGFVGLALVSGGASGAIAQRAASSSKPSGTRVLRAGVGRVVGPAHAVNTATLPIAHAPTTPPAPKAAIHRRSRMTPAQQAAYRQYVLTHPNALPQAAATPLPKAGANFVGGGVIPALVSKSAGIDSSQSGGWYPPDQAIAAAPGYVFEGVNNVMVVYNWSYGVKYGPWTPDTFFASVKHSGDFFSDPQITFDAERAIYLISWLEINPTTGHDYIDLGISKTSSPSPLGNFYVYQVPATATGSDDFCDYQTLGYDYWGAYITCVTYSVSNGQQTGNRVFAFNTSAMLSGALGAFNYWYNVPSDVSCVNTGTCLPAVSVSPSIEDGVPQAEWVIATDEGVGTIETNLTLCAITNTQAIGKSSPPTFTCDFNMINPGYADAVGARQPGTTATIDPGFGMKQITYHNGRIYFAQATSINCNGTPEDGVQWADVTPELTTFAAHTPQWVNGINENTIEDSYICFSGVTDAYMPTLIPSSENDVTLVYNLSSSASNIYPSIGYTGRMAVDAPGTMGQGTVTAYVVQGTASNDSGRWGDYSACALTTNLVSRGTVFCGGEFGGPHTALGGYGWDTELYSLRME